MIFSKKLSLPIPTKRFLLGCHGGERIYDYNVVFAECRGAFLARKPKTIPAPIRAFLPG